MKRNVYVATERTLAWVLEVTPVTRDAVVLTHITCIHYVDTAWTRCALV